MHTSGYRQMQDYHHARKLIIVNMGHRPLLYTVVQSIYRFGGLGFIIIRHFELMSADPDLRSTFQNLSWRHQVVWPVVSIFFSFISGIHGSRIRIYWYAISFQMTAYEYF